MLFRPSSILWFVSLGLFTGHGAGELFPLIDVVSGKIPISTPVEYSCEFTSLWTAKDHPNDFPSNYHWSPMVLAAHSDKYSMWSEGADVTAGVQSVAETGSTTGIKTELGNAGDDVGGFTVASPGFFPSAETTTRKIEDLMMDEEHSYLSSITMVAPSPDWFTGFYDVRPVQDDMWLDSFSILTHPWDAGTDSGDTYRSTNQATNPQEGVFQLVPENLPSSDVFLAPDKENVKPVARWGCSIITSENDTTIPSSLPTVFPSLSPTFTFSSNPTLTHTTHPSQKPSNKPSSNPNLGNDTDNDTGDDGETFSLIDVVTGETPLSTPVEYSCEFTSLWTAKDHPNDFPSNYHWSPMVLAAHSDKYSMWSEGADVTTGVQSVAETGSTTGITTELENAGDNVVGFTISSPGFFPDADTTTRKIEAVRVDEERSYLSSITMVAPSPDWFTGFYDVRPVQDDMWLDSFSVLTHPWDAGTDSGDTYLSANQATNPHEGVFQLVPENLPSSDVFLAPDEENVKPVARWRCSIVIDDDDEQSSGNESAIVSFVKYVLSLVAFLFACSF